MSKHTPGKWEYNCHGAHVVSDNPYGKGYMIVADVRGWGHLTGTGCGACKMHPEDAEDIQNANGRLIAAAPKMLELLQDIADVSDQTHVVLKIRELLKEIDQ